MNLALRDVRHHAGRFVLTALGVGMLLMVVMGMGGIYRGLIDEGTLLIDSVGADIWIVQRDTRGPFAELSRVPRTLVDRVATVPGVTSAREFVTHTIQREHAGKRLRIVLVGLSWPTDKGEHLPLIAGRPLAQNHYEIIVDRSLKLSLGTKLRLGRETYTVVGLTRGMTSWGGDGAALVTVNDAQAIQFDQPGEAIRLERAARGARGEHTDFVRRQPQMLERATGPSTNIPALGPPSVSAVIARVAPGVDAEAVCELISAWGDVTAMTHAQQQHLILSGPVERSGRQLSLFRTMLTIVSAIVMALILYTLTIDKLHDIAMLKLIGAPNRVILGIIMQQAIVLGMLGFGVAYLLGREVFPYFPRRIVLVEQDLLELAGVVLGISILASGLGIWRALRVSPGEVLSR
ncbi:MAG: ABC transporter permease [bacterium]|nr:ABC transporter permease [bacterium]